MIVSDYSHTGHAMLKSLIPLVTLALISACAPRQAPQADLSNWQDILAERGLSAAESHLAGQPTTPETAFLLGGLQFLRANEAIMQVRYQNSAGSIAILPGMRNQLPTNPEGRFDPAFLETALERALVQLAKAETSLGSATEEDFAVEFPIGAIWFDINSNGQREDWESGLAIMAALNAEADEGFDGVIRFDGADAHWLKAYVHVMSGMAELTLATDPTPAIRTVHEGRQQLEQLGATQVLFIGNDELDMIASVLLTLRGVPDRTRTRAAHHHFKAMIHENQAFWQAVGEETDNDREWLPNPQQSSVFGVEVSQEMADGWRDVLVEIDDILNGRKLVPHWRSGPNFGETSGLGLNIAKFLQEPGDMDIVLWIHGAAAAPYLEQGPLADMESWQRFETMTRGDSMLFAMWFN